MLLKTCSQGHSSHSRRLATCEALVRFFSIALNLNFKCQSIEVKLLKTNQNSHSKNLNGHIEFLFFEL
jgi:hypothetical protein